MPIADQYLELGDKAATEAAFAKAAHVTTLKLVNQRVVVNHQETGLQGHGRNSAAAAIAPRRPAASSCTRSAPSSRSVFCIRIQDCSRRQSATVPL